MTKPSTFRLTLIAALLLATGCATSVVNGGPGPDTTGAGGGTSGGGDANPCSIAADCANAACDGKPVDCGAPTAPTCISATTLRVASAAGTCMAGACSHGSADTEFPSGCTTAPRPVTLSAGGSQTCAVTSSGALVRWGNSPGSPPAIVKGLESGVVAAAASWDHHGGILAGGALVLQGGPIIGPPATYFDPVAVGVPGFSSGVVALSLAYPPCVLKDSGGLLCWAVNPDGTFTDSKTDPGPDPAIVKGLESGVVAVVGGNGHGCALTATGAVKCFGRNLEGQLGNGTAVSSLVPVDVTGLSSGVLAISAGWSHACAITSAGAVRCWGGLMEDATGTAGFTNSLAPVEVAGLSSGVVAIAAGKGHTCAIVAGGAVKCWGYNLLGQLGNGTTAASMVPVDVVGLSADVVEIAAGDDHTCARLSTGAIECWGDNLSGQLGNAEPGSLVPVDVPGF